MLEIVREAPSADADGAADVAFADRRGAIHADLTIGANLVVVSPLQANERVCTNGVALHGQGFILTPEIADRLRATGDTVIKRYLGGKDLLKTPRELYAIDFSFMTEEEARMANPVAFQHVIDYVKPERDHNSRASIREKWWRFAWERPVLMKALKGLSRYIATTETAKHRVFQFLPREVLPDHMILAIASDDAFVLGVLSSRVHVAFALTTGGRLGVGNDPRYNKSRCFDPFPFPAASERHKERIRDIAEKLDAHRKARQAENPALSLTDAYNVLAKLRSGKALTAKDRTTHEFGLVSILRQLHDELDAAVLDAYGWPTDIDDETLLTRLAALNAERTEEEQQGRVRWLRPDLRSNGDAESVQADLVRPADRVTNAQDAEGALPWPKALPDRIGAIRDFFVMRTESASAADVRSRFKHAPSRDVVAALDTLSSLGLLVRYEASDGPRWRAPSV